MRQSAFGRQHDMPEKDIGDTWRAMIADQVRTLEELLHRFRATLPSARLRRQLPPHSWRLRPRQRAAAARNKAQHSKKIQ